MVHRLLLACRSPTAANSKITQSGRPALKASGGAPMPGREGRA
ncbi:hypothetical protein CDS [Bradyrhizobium sp.]|nr:hypothetical protein CDS [Bradyrhizobium sp.]